MWVCVCGCDRADVCVCVGDSLQAAMVYGSIMSPCAMFPAKWKSNKSASAVLWQSVTGERDIYTIKELIWILPLARAAEMSFHMHMAQLGLRTQLK